MNDEKIDLAEIEKDALADLAHANIEASQTSETAHLVRALRRRARQKLALVAAVRAAREMDHAMTSAVRGVDLRTYRMELHSALAPFADSAEVRSDGE